MPDFATLALLLSAAFLAGGMNAMAGGGTFLTLPALIYAGVPPVAANATGTVALLPGYMSGTWGFRRDLKPVGSVGLLPLSAVCLAGGLVGAGLLLVTPDTVFRAIVPWLLLAATALFAFGRSSGFLSCRFLERLELGRLGIGRRLLLGERMKLAGLDRSDE